MTASKVPQGDKPITRGCVICGGRLKHSVHQTCTFPFCLAMISLHPELRKNRRNRNEADRIVTQKIRHNAAKARHIRTSPQDLRYIAIMQKECNFLAADWSLRGFIINSDNRGIGDVRDTIWGFLSRRKILLKAWGKTMSEPALTIKLPAGLNVHEYVRQQWGGGNSRVELLHEIFYAWRCVCPLQKQVIYRTIEDLPMGPGYHDACSSCGAAPLEVIAV